MMQKESLWDWLIPQTYVLAQSLKNKQPQVSWDDDPVAATVTPEASTCVKYEINENLHIEMIKSSKTQYKDNIKICVKLETFNDTWEWKYECHKEFSLWKFKN